MFLGLKCAKLSTFCILHIFATTDVVAVSLKQLNIRHGTIPKWEEVTINYSTLCQKKKGEKTTIQQIQRIKDQKRKKKNEANSNRYVDFSKNWGSTTHIPPYRVKGPKSIYIRPWPRTLSDPRTYKQYQRCKARCPMSKLQMKGLGRVCRGGISLWLNEAKIKTCVLPSMVTFQEVLLIRTCIMNVQEEWELRNI